MPIFEYTCSNCQKDSEILVRNEADIHCPFCQSPKLSKKLSLFASQTPPAHVHTPSCGCGQAPGSCGLN